MRERQVSLTALVKELAATFIQQEANSNPLITVTNVEVSPDMKNAIIFVTTIPDGREKDALVFLKRNGSELRNYFKQKARIKHIPNFEFMIDAGEKHRQHMDELVKEIATKK
jgi:ribosome-binding factor A